MLGFYLTLPPSLNIVLTVLHSKLLLQSTSCTYPCVCMFQNLYLKWQSLIYKVYISYYGQWFYRVDLCHQANDEEDDDDENSTQQSLLENSIKKPGSSNSDSHRICCSFQNLHIGSRQKFVIAVREIEFFLLFLILVIAATELHIKYFLSFIFLCYSC